MRPYFIHGTCIYIMVQDIGTNSMRDIGSAQLSKRRLWLLLFVVCVLVVVVALYGRKLLSDNGNIRILAVGDSTILRSTSWPVLLEKKLKMTYPNVSLKVSSMVVVNAKELNTTETLKRITVYKPNIVIAMMGTNDPTGSHLSSEGVSTGDNGLVYSLKSILPTSKDLDWDIVELGNYFIDEGALKKAEEAFQAAISRNTHNEWAHIELANLYRSSRRFQEAVDHYKQALSINTLREDAWLELGDVYGKLDIKEEQARAFAKYTEISGRAPHPPIGERFRHQARYDERERALLERIHNEPSVAEHYIQLGTFYRDRGNRTGAIEAFRSAVTRDFTTGALWGQIGIMYRQEGKLSDAEESLRRAVARKPNDDLALLTLSDLYSFLGRNEEAEALEDRTYLNTEEFQTSYRNFARQMLSEDRAFIAVSYPFRPVDRLKKIFINVSGVLLVDNETVFKEAVSKESFASYFEDCFAGDFGHTTLRGSALLADTIARTIGASPVRDMIGH